MITARLMTILALALATTTANAQAVESEPATTPVERGRFHLAFGTGIGASIDAYANGRHGGGFAWGMYAHAGFRISERLSIGGTFWFDPAYAVHGEASDGGNFSTPIAAFLWLGPSVALTGENVTTTFGIVIGGGATIGTGAPNYGYGGAGFMLFGQLDLWLGEASFGRFGPFGRLGLGYLHDPALRSEFQGCVSINLGFAVQID